MVLWVCLGVGINNFASDRVAMRAVIEQLGDLDSVTSYGATGNLVVSSALSGRDVAERLGERTRRQWAVVPLARIARNVEEIAETELPSEAGDRWTRGVAFPVEPAEQTTLHDVYRAKLWWTSDGEAVGVMKRDILDDRGRLDPTQRLGGWGAVSGEIRRQVRGKWTSRSLRVVEGLLAKAS
jgi:uncharacterized protein (DUF1697 family)